jgi:hypothetical protein
VILETGGGKLFYSSIVTHWQPMLEPPSE